MWPPLLNWTYWGHWEKDVAYYLCMHANWFVATLHSYSAISEPKNRGDLTVVIQRSASPLHLALAKGKEETAAADSSEHDKCPKEALKGLVF